MVIKRRFNPRPILAVIEAFNALPAGERPRFVIHTGDGIDAGTIAELYDFVTISRELHFPFLTVLGNHDDAIFGNYKSQLGYTREAGPDLYPVATSGRFLSMLTPKTRDCGGLGPQLLPLPLNLHEAEMHDWTRLATPDATGGAVETGCFGFDLPSGIDRRAARELRRLSGLLRVHRHRRRRHEPRADRRPRLDQSKGLGPGGTIGGAQLAFLDAQFAKPADSTLVFLHHRTETLKPLEAKLLALASRRPVAAFTAHVHSHDVKWHGKQTGYWELNTGSVEEFPQWARLVEIRRQADGRFYLDAQTLRPKLASQEAEEWDRDPDAQRALRLKDIERHFADCDQFAALEQLPACASAPDAAAPSERPRAIRGLRLLGRGARPSLRSNGGAKGLGPARQGRAL